MIIITREASQMPIQTSLTLYIPSYQDQPYTLSRQNDLHVLFCISTFPSA